MHTDRIYTSSFALGDYLYIYRLPTSTFCKGSGETFAFAGCIDPELNLPRFGEEHKDPRHEALPHYFLVYNAATQQTEEHFVGLNYRDSLRIQVGYDHANSTWIAALDAFDWQYTGNADRTTNKVLDFYEISNTDHTQWRRITSIETLRIFFSINEAGLANGLEDDGKSLQAFWQHEDTFPLLMCGDFRDGLSRSSIYLAQWRSYPQHLRHNLGWIGFVYKTHIFDDVFLLFTCDCPEDTLQWHIRFTLFGFDGNKITEICLPDMSFPSHRGKYAVADDLWDWLHPTMQIVSGPLYNATQKPTCIAALQLRDHPERSWKKTQYTYREHTLPKFQGGLYCIDCDGTIVQQYRTRLGENLNMCLCSDKIIGIDFIDEHWRLWYWFPFDHEDMRTTSTEFSPDVTYITLITMNQDYQQKVSHFWCIEEYEKGIRVSLWDAHHLRQLAQSTIDDLILPQSYSGTKNLLRRSIATYQDTLLLIGIDSTRHLQLFRFKADL